MCGEAYEKLRSMGRKLLCRVFGHVWLLRSRRRSEETSYFVAGDLTGQTSHKKNVSSGLQCFENAYLDTHATLKKK